MKSIMTVDIEYDWETKESRNLKEVVPKLLDFFDKYKIRATFFVLGSLAEKNEKMIKEISTKHEIASHSYDHVNFSKLNENETAVQVLKSKKVFDSIGIKVRGFRAPYFKTNNYLYTILKAAGFEYDSSEFGKRIYNKEGILEFQVPSFVPFVRCGLSYFRLLYPFSKFFKPKHMFFLHPHEFMDEIPHSTTTMPFLTKQLLEINKGANAWKIFEYFINKQKIKWVGCWDYLKNE